MSKKSKKILIGVLVTIIVLISGGIIGGNLYIDSILNKMDQKEEFNKKEVKANKLNGDVENIALLGIDNDAGSEVHRSDVMKIISLDFKNDKIKITSLQRDNLVYIPMQNKYDKLNHAYRDDGVQGTLATLNYNFDLDITKYVKFEFDSVVQIVDKLGGVSINLSNAEAGVLGMNAGAQILNGKQALSYSRIRSVDSDYNRMQRQNNVINSLIASVSGKSPFELLDVVNSVMPYLETNVSNGTIKNYATSLISFKLGETEQHQFPSQGYNSILTSLTLYGYGPHYVLKDFSGEVEKLHKNIYDAEYKVTKNVKKVEEEVLNIAGR